MPSKLRLEKLIFRVEGVGRDVEMRGETKDADGLRDRVVRYSFFFPKC